MKLSEEFITNQGKALLRHKLREQINHWSGKLLNVKRNQFLIEHGWNEVREKSDCKDEVIKQLGIEKD